MVFCIIMIKTKKFLQKQNFTIFCSFCSFNMYKAINFIHAFINEDFEILSQLF